MTRIFKQKLKRGCEVLVSNIPRACGLSIAIAVTASAASAAETPPGPGESIVVTSKKLSTETLIDRKVYSVAEDVQSDFGTLSDILNVIPSIDVDSGG